MRTSPFFAPSSSRRAGARLLLQNPGARSLDNWINITGEPPDSCPAHLKAAREVSGEALGETTNMALNMALTVPPDAAFAD